MFVTVKVKAPVIRASKINHKSPILHPMANFVTEEAVAMMFGISIDQIQRIDCYRYMVYVHGANVSRFVSYADFPPPQTVDSLDSYTFYCWRKRWRRRWNSCFAPDWWGTYYINQMQQSFSDADLIKWCKVIILIKSALSPSVWQQITQTPYFVKVL
jgi:hypothetical protein